MRKTPPVTGGTDRGPSVMNMNNRILSGACS